jgi:hypothetical protein
MISYRSNLAGLPAPAPARAMAPPAPVKRGTGPRRRRSWSDGELALLRAAVQSGGDWGSYGPELVARTGRTPGSITGKIASLRAVGRL